MRERLVVVAAAGDLKAAAGAWAAAAALEAPDAAPSGFVVPTEATPRAARGCRDACLGAADRLTAVKALALANPLAARLADGAANRDAAAADALVDDDPAAAAALAVSALAGKALADLLRARIAAKEAGDAYGDAVAHAKLGYDRLECLEVATPKKPGAWPGGGLGEKTLWLAACGSDRCRKLKVAAKRYAAALENDNKTVYFSRVPERPPLADAPLAMSKPTDVAMETPDLPPLLKTPSDDDPELALFDPPRHAELVEKQRLADEAEAEKAAQLEADAEAAAKLQEEEAAERDMGNVNSFFKPAPAASSPAASPSATRFLEVKCPEGKGPGDVLLVNGPDGLMISATVPAGIKPGGKFLVSLASIAAPPAPAASPDAAAPPTTSPAPPTTPPAPPPPPPAAPKADPVARLAEMGFERPLCERAISKFGGDVDAALQWLLVNASSPGGPASAVVPPPAYDDDLALARQLAAEDSQATVTSSMTKEQKEAEDRRFAEQLRAQLDDENAKARAEAEARDAAFARSLADASVEDRPPPTNPFA